MDDKQFKKFMRRFTILWTIFAILIAFIIAFLLPRTTQEVNNYIGAEGKSAYQVAVSQGFVGSEKAWITSLKGKDGTDSKSVNTVTVVEKPTIIENHSIIEKTETVNTNTVREQLVDREIEFSTDSDCNVVWRYVGTRGWNVLITSDRLIGCGVK